MKDSFNVHCVKSARIRSYFSSNTGKYGPEITPHLDTFHAVLIFAFPSLAQPFFSLMTTYVKLLFLSYAIMTRLHAEQENLERGIFYLATKMDS